MLFDIDGTLVDSNYAHVAAWSRALDDVGRAADSWRIHRAIGMDSQKLLNELLGDRAEQLGERASQAHSRHYLASADALRAFDGARELVQAVVDGGWRAVLATSAPQQELELLRRVLSVDPAIDTVTSASDVGEAKPAPDVVQVALRRAGVRPERAVMVGDSVWDVQAASRAGVATIGLLSGGTGGLELTRAGAIAVYDDAADLLAHYRDSPLAQP